MGRFTLDNGPEIVRFNFSNTILSDNEVGRCEIVVISGQYIVSGRQLIFQDQATIVIV